MPIQVTKAFQVSKMLVYADGDPQPYVAEIKFPSISSETVEFNNTSLGGKVEIADPFRYFADGDGEIKFESADSRIHALCVNASRSVSLNCTMIINNMEPQTGTFLPLSDNYKAVVQFFGCDLGTIAPGQKRELTAKFKMHAIKFVSNGITSFDYDFVNSSLINNGADLLTGVTNLLS